jgi:hypothetical protein
MAPDTAETVTLRDFFGGASALAEKLPAIEGSPAIRALMAAVAAGAGAVGWPRTLGGVAEQLAAALSVSVPRMLAGAWNRYRVLQKYADPKRANEVALVPLAKHTVKSRHTPSVEVVVNEARIGKIDFVVAVELELEGAVLKIQGGKITEIQVASCKGKGTLTCEGYVLLDEKSKAFPLLRNVKLEDPIEIS